MQFSNSAFFIVLSLSIMTIKSMANPPYQAEDRGLEPGHHRKCPQPRGQFPHFRYCDWFYNCWDGAVFVQQCPKGLAFNPQFQYCDYPANVDCGRRDTYADTSVDSMCPAPDGVFPDPWDCSYFVQCAGGRGTRQVCPAGLNFNPKFLGCDYPENVKCSGNVIEPSTEAPNIDPRRQCPSGHYPHTSCQSYWSCDGQQMVLKYCPAGQQFDASTCQCRDSQHVQCHVSMATESPAGYGGSDDQQTVSEEVPSY